jgi:hypothetical protein
MSRLPPPNPQIAAEVAKLPPEIHVEGGSRHLNVDAAIAAMRNDGQFYNFGTSVLARVVDGRIVSHDVELLQRELARVARFTAPDGKGGARPIDPPQQIAKQILSMKSERKLPALSGITTMPTLRADGSLLATPGYDKASGIYLHAPAGVPKVSDKPSRQEVLAALEFLWKPFHLFQFEGPEDRGVMMAALMSAVLRPSLPTCPGFANTAHAAGSGKTLLADCVHVLATGHESVTPPKSGEELRKQLYSALLAGKRALLIDNQKVSLSGAALAALLTGENYTDRTLGVSREETLPNKLLLLFTGKNLTADDEIARRVLVARITAGEDRYTRVYPFDPLAMMYADRAAYTAAVLTIVRGHMAAGAPQMVSTGLASYTKWNEWVRQPLLWAASLAGGDPLFGDPVASVQRMGDESPENERLDKVMAAVLAVMGEEPWTVAELLAKLTVFDGHDKEAAGALRAVLKEVAPARSGVADVDPVQLGVYLRDEHGQKRPGVGMIEHAGKDARLKIARWKVRRA